MKNKLKIYIVLFILLSPIYGYSSGEIECLNWANAPHLNNLVRNNIFFNNFNFQEQLNGEFPPITRLVYYENIFQYQIIEPGNLLNIIENKFINLVKYKYDQNILHDFTTLFFSTYCQFPPLELIILESIKDIPDVQSSFKIDNFYGLIVCRIDKITTISFYCWIKLSGMVFKITLIYDNNRIIKIEYIKIAELIGNCALLAKSKYWQPTFEISALHPHNLYDKLELPCQNQL